jgi:integrase
MILTAFSHGLRASEVCQLTTKDLADGHLTIKRLKGSNATTHQLVPHRGVPLLDEVKAIKEWLSERPNDAGNALFTSNKGGCMSSTQFYRIFRAIAEECGLPAHKQHPHVLKHTTCTMLVRSDMNVAKIQAFVGHKAIASTMKYVTVSDAEASAEATTRLMRMNS